MFFFFSLVMPLGFFSYIRRVRQGDLRRRLSFWPVLALTVMGSFWGLERATGHVSRTRHPAPLPRHPRYPSAMLASSILANYYHPADRGRGILLTRIVFHVPGSRQSSGVFLLVYARHSFFGSLGLVVASVTNTMQETQVINQLLWLPLIFLSGATMPFPICLK